MDNSFTVTVWNNGSHNKSGAGYGLKISVTDRDNYFKKTTKSAILYLEGQKNAISVNTDKPSFWNPVCRELISKDIGVWLIENKMAKWKAGHPPKFSMISKGKNQFLLKK